MPGWATVSSVASTSIDEALVGPVCRWVDEPQKAPAMAATMAA